MILTGMCLSFVMTGCGGMNEGSDLEGQQVDLFRGYQQPERHFVINRNIRGNAEQYNRFGFNRNNKETAYAGQSAPGYATYDRPLLAESISKMATTNDSVDDCAVLVTDQHVLMTYEKSGDESREEVAEQMKQTALSLVPAYYDIYVSDDPNMAEEIERFQGLSPKEQHYQDSLEQTIERMKTYPQGEPLEIDDFDHEDSRMDQEGQEDTNRRARQ